MEENKTKTRNHSNSERTWGKLHSFCRSLFYCKVYQNMREELINCKQYEKLFQSHIRSQKHIRQRVL